MVFAPLAELKHSPESCCAGGMTDGAYDENGDWHENEAKGAVILACGITSSKLRGMNRRRADGIELRFMFCRFFVPYTAIEGPVWESRWYRRGLVINSDLPGVPGMVRFWGGGEDLADLIKERRALAVQAEAPSNTGRTDEN